MAKNSLIHPFSSGRPPIQKLLCQVCHAIHVGNRLTVKQMLPQTHFQCVRSAFAHCGPCKLVSSGWPHLGADLSKLLSSQCSIKEMAADRHKCDSLHDCKMSTFLQDSSKAITQVCGIVDICYMHQPSLISVTIR